MRMTNAELRKFLAEHGQEIQPGYNYTMLCITVPAAEVANTVALIRRHKTRIEREYAKAMKGRGGSDVLKRITLLPFVCLPRKRSMLVPVPHGCAINMVSTILAELPGLHAEAGVPVWS